MFVNGQWFTGTGFERRTFYSVNGLLETRAPARVDRTIDLAGGFEEEARRAALLTLANAPIAHAGINALCLIALRTLHF